MGLQAGPAEATVVENTVYVPLGPAWMVQILTKRTFLGGVRSIWGLRLFPAICFQSWSFGEESGC